MQSDARGSELAFLDQLHAQKYRDDNQTREEHSFKMAGNLASNKPHESRLFEMFMSERFLPAGRVQASMGSTREVSAFNCAVSGVIPDSTDGIFDRLKEAAKTLRLGTGIGYNFSSLRPSDFLIKRLKTEASGPIAFMKMYDSMCKTIMSAGHRRGAQMGILNVGHPDIEKFIDAKSQRGQLETFNISVGITDEFMAAVANGSKYKQRFNGEVVREISATYIWEKIIKSAYYTAEPGLIFLDTVNRMNNLFYCEDIQATNPCSEQPLPPYGLCLLGSFNLTQYIKGNPDSAWFFDKHTLAKDIYDIVEAYDNIFDKSIYAIPQQEIDAKAKRRMGLGFTGVANAIERVGGLYGNGEFVNRFRDVAAYLRDVAYSASTELAERRGPFEMYSPEYCDGGFFRTLPLNIQKRIAQNGIRNSHLISYAPCGTISLIAGNVSSGVEPVFAFKQERAIILKQGRVVVDLQDYNRAMYGMRGRRSADCSIDDHMNVLSVAQDHCDSAVSKTVNTPYDCSYSFYEGIYNKAFSLGVKGITVYRPTELRGSVIVDKDDIEQNAAPPVEQAAPILDCQGDRCAFTGG